MFPSSQVAPSTCARAVAPAVTTPSRHCSVTSNIRAMVGVSSVDLCTSFDVFGLLVYTINHRSLCTVGRGTGADPQRRAVLSWVYGRRKRDSVATRSESVPALCTLKAVGLLPVSGCGDARVAPPCPTTLCVWRNLPYLTLHVMTDVRPLSRAVAASCRLYMYPLPSCLYRAKSD